MKRWLRFLGLLVLWVFASLSIFLISLRGFGTGNYWIRRDSVGIEIYQGGYRSWEVSWSHGDSFWWQSNRVTHAWCWPYYSHNDLRADYGTNFPESLKQ